MKSSATGLYGYPVYIWGCIAIAFMIPFAKRLVPALIILLVLYLAVAAIRRKKDVSTRLERPLLLLVLIYLLHLAGLSYSEHRDEGLKEVGIKLSYIVFPLIAWLIPVISHKERKSIEQAFIYGCLAFIPVAIIFGIYRAMTFNDAGYLAYEKLGIFLHPTYAATYQSMALFVLLTSGDLSPRLKKFAYPFAILIVIFIAMLASKAGLIAAGISLLMAAGVLWKSNQYRQLIGYRVLPLLALLVVLTAALPGISGRIQAAVRDVEQHEEPSIIIVDGNTEAQSSTRLRFVTWRASVDLLSKTFIGAGTGDTSHELRYRYEKMNEHYAAKRSLNSHNQFLQAGAEHGWPGLLLLIATLVLLFRFAIRHADLLMLNFLVLCAMNFMFESFLEVQAGIVFFCFWVMIFVRSATLRIQGAGE